MNQKLIASVAATALFAGASIFAPAAFAQDATAPAAPAATTAAPAASGSYLTEQGADQISANTYIGQPVYNSADESIGEINDVIFTSDGSVEAAVIGVGGFLGIGEKNVAVPLDTINVAAVPDSTDIKLTTQETADTLKAAPEFRTKSQQMAEQNSATPVDGSTTSSTTTPAPASPMEPATPSAEPATPAAPAAPATNN